MMPTPEERIADVWRRWTESVYGLGEQDGMNERAPMSSRLSRMFADAVRAAVAEAEARAREEEREACANEAKVYRERFARSFEEDKAAELIEKRILARGRA